jgi:hypothetical protein
MDPKAVTVAVQVTFCPQVEGLRLELRAVVAAAMFWILDTKEQQKPLLQVAWKTPRLLSPISLSC